MTDAARSPGGCAAGTLRRSRMPVIGVLLPLLAAHPARSQTTASLEELAASAMRAVVLIDVETASGSRQGSGFLVDAGGRVLTNEHVIRDARAARVRLSSGDVYDVLAVLAADERRDIAVIQIPGFDLPSLPLGNSDSVRIGNPVVLIGSPLGLENTVTTGIISGRRQEPEGFQLLQLSAPASRGSSGGPVLSLAGEVVAIASSQMQTGQNLNFAVPINYARGLLGHLEQEPFSVLSPQRQPVQESPVPLAATGATVNRGIQFDMEGFGGYEIELEARSGLDLRRRIRVTYRVIETVSGDARRIERYIESETTRRSGPFGTEQTVRRERTRTLVRADGLQPVSTRGEVVQWTDSGWEEAHFTLDFEGYHVRGLIVDVGGRARELDRALPEGIILRDTADLAFGQIAIDSLAGRSVEFVVFDAMSGEVLSDRYDVLDVGQVSAGGDRWNSLRVSIARDLSNTTAWFSLERPRVLLRREGGEANETEEIVRFQGPR